METRRLLTLAMGALALTFGFCAKVGAQQSAATASAGPSAGFVNPLPVTPPGGWDPKFYAAFREKCGEIWQKSGAGKPLTRDEFTESETCHSSLPPPPSMTREPSYPQPRFHGSPLPTPQPQSSNDAPNGDPPAGPFGTPITALAMDACSNGQPPDVAADVSPAQVVELLNAGIWISDKQGNVASGYPKSLTTFWSPESIPSGNFLPDTQIAYDPLAATWLATTLSVPSARNNGDLYFAFSQTSDATGPWNFYKVANVCSGTQSGNFPVPDQPVIGYNQTWIAVDLACEVVGGGLSGTDQLVLVASSLLTQANPVFTYVPLTPPFDGARPSRDISGNGTQNLFLAASVVPSSTSLPYVVVTTVDANHNFVGPGPGGATVQSPGNGVPGTAGNFPLAQHDSCGAGAACDVSLQDDRITNVVLQAGNDGHYYLLTSFHAGDQTNSSTQALFFMGQADSFATTNQWNGWYVYGPSFWAGYPTITADTDLDTAFSFTTFELNSNIYPNWYIGKGFIPNDNSFAQNPPLLGYGILANSNRGAYNGCPSQIRPQRWGDYMSTVWDSSLPSPNESSGFWTVQEYSNGAGTQPGSNESTQITKLADPLPWFVGYSLPVTPLGRVGENECGTAGTECKLNYSVPSGAQYGDVLIAEIAIGEDTDKSYLHLTTGWTALKIVNQSNDLALRSSNAGAGGSTYITSFLAAYVYGSQPNDSGQYTLGITPQTSAAEILGFLVAYRGASQVIPGNYELYGFPGTQNTDTAVAGKVTPNVESTLVDIFTADCFNNDTESGENEAFGAPTAKSGPSLTPETPLNPTSTSASMAADAPVPQAGVTYGAYTSKVCAQYYYGGLNYAYQLIVLEL